MSSSGVVVFSGHMIDAVSRAEPRFPSELESAARVAIADAVSELVERSDGPMVAMSAAANGGDILFQEVCREAGLATEVFLGLPPDQFRVSSVASAGSQWERRFDETLASSTVHVMRGVEDSSPLWDAANEWMLQAALDAAPEDVAVLVLWDEQVGDAGGTSHFVDRASALGLEVKVLDVGRLRP